MDKLIAKGLSDRLYEKRKATALELEKVVKQCLVEGDYARIDTIIDELCRNYAYALHQPVARNAGLMGLAATSIALGSANLGKYLDHILPPVLACFGDQNDQVRFYACESLYNIAKIAKGEILVYFNEIFDVLCKISADTDNSVKGAAELLDRLIKDIVAERASNYISMVNNDPKELPAATEVDKSTGNVYQVDYIPTDTAELAFSLPRFITLLSERIYAINPDTRMFLVDWLKVLLNTPGLELISYLPSFLGGLFTFMGDPHKDVRTITHSLLNLLLYEVDRISKLQQALKTKNSQLSETNNTIVKKSQGPLITEKKKTLLNAMGNMSLDSDTSVETISKSIVNQNTEDLANTSRLSDNRDGEEYVPDQDIRLNFPGIVEILVNNLSSSEINIQLVALHWMEVVLSLAAEEFVPFLSKILSVLLKLLGDSDSRVSESAKAVNKLLTKLCQNYDYGKEPNVIPYGSIINSLTLQFFDSKIDAKIACLDWLVLIYRKAPEEILEYNDSMFLTLLKSLSDDDNRLVEKALGLLESLCSDSNDNYMRKFIQDLLALFRRDSKLFKLRANYILRQICARLSPERIYRVTSFILRTNEDKVFVRMMLQILSTNLLTAPETSTLRNKLRNGEEGNFFNILFKSWCPNPVSVIALCLVAERYELAYSVVEAYVNYDLGINDLIQLDVLVQLLESPSFARMRMQLLEQAKYPYLYKCLYGILMILPQSKAFQILNKRLVSLSTWSTQPVQSNTLRHSSLSSTSSDSSQRSVSEYKQKSQELLEHFNKMCKDLRSTTSYGAYYEAELPLLGSYVRNESGQYNEAEAFVGEVSHGNADRSFLPADSSSVIYRSSAEGTLPHKL